MTKEFFRVKEIACQSEVHILFMVLTSLLTYDAGKERKHWALRPQKPLRLIRDGEVGGGGAGMLYLTLTRYTVTTRMILH